MVLKARHIVGLFLVFLVAATSCRKLDDHEYDPTPYVLEYGELPRPEIPDDNPLTVQGVLLGRMLFYEPALSRNNKISCSSCHLQENAFSDPRKFSLGVDELPGKRHAMAVFNMAYNSNEFFWDGRAHLLRDQSLMPIEDHLEMAESLENVLSKLQSKDIYRAQFIRAFGTGEITALKMSLALEQFMNSIVSYNSKYDQYLRGEATFTPSEARGLALFNGEYNPFFPLQSGADCHHCHGTKTFEIDKYKNNGIDPEANFTDLGREIVTGDPRDRAKFKIPSLRNVEVTAPYMHDGRFQTLEEVVDHYNNGLFPSSTLDITLENTRITGLMLDDQEKADLIAFLKTLTDQDLLSNPAYASPF